MDAPVPRDIYAERALIGCMLETAQPTEDFDPLFFFDDDRRVLFCALDLLRNKGMLVPVIDSLNTGHCMRVRASNAALVADVVEQAKTWQGVEDPRRELLTCIYAATLPCLADYHCGCIRKAYEARELILHAQGVLQWARVPRCWEAQC